MPRGHRARIASAREAWLARALATGPADRPAVEAALATLYIRAGLPAPVVLWRRSPAAGAQAVSQLQGTAAADARVRHGVGSFVLGRVQAGAYAQLDMALHGASTERLRVMLEQEVGAWLAGRLASLRTTIEDGATRRLDRPPGVPIRGQLPAWPAPWQHVMSAGLGHLDADRIALHDVARQLGLHRDVEHAALLDALVVLAGSGWCWPFEGIVVVCERPTVIHLDEALRPHASDGPAVVYDDGLELFAWHGTLVPRRVIELETLTVRAIANEPNIEVRRLMIERYGVGRFRRHAGAELVHRDRWGTLWRLRLPGDEPLTTVEVVNSTPEPDGRRRRYELRVPPTMRTALGAVAWTFGLSPAAYARRMRRET